MRSTGKPLECVLAGQMGWTRSINSVRPFIAKPFQPFLGRHDLDDLQPEVVAILTASPRPIGRLLTESWSGESQLCENSMMEPGPK